MKKLLIMMIILFSIYLAIQFGFKFFGTGHNVSYRIKSEGIYFDVDELYILNHKKEINNYYFKIKINDNAFSFQTYEDFNRSDMVIKKIKYFKDDNQECLLPIFRDDKIIFDIMCIKNNTITYYHDLKGQNQALDDFATNLNEEKYNVTKWEDDKSGKIENAPITTYPNNIVDDHYVGINNYKGIYTINSVNLKKIVSVKIFEKDIYERPLSAIVGKYYVTADYESEYDFSKLYIVDLTSNSVYITNSSNKISFDTYIQGIVDNSLYIFDRVNKKQYELDMKTRTVIEVGNNSTDIKIYNKGTWEKVKATEAAKNDVLFKTDANTSSDAIYDRIDKVGSPLSGYSYFYKKDGDTYKVYRADSRNKDLITYLFSTNKIDNINYIHDYVYFSENNEVKYYYDKTGVKTLFKNDEFEFNKSLFYNVYLK